MINPRENLHDFELNKHFLYTTQKVLSVTEKMIFRTEAICKTFSIQNIPLEKKNKDKTRVGNNIYKLYTSYRNYLHNI